MDKLQPLIKHRYWIIFSLAVIFVIVGWWLASGAIAVATETRRKSVDDSFSKATQGKNDPNAAWVKVAQDRNAVDEKSKMNAAKMLWERQQAARTWPESLAKDFKNVPFQGEVKEVQTRRKWKKFYKDQIESLLKIVQPYDAVKKEGLVVVTINSIDHKPFTKWRYQDPVSTEIWTCQEDIWLLQSLLTSIARVNGEAKRITESNVRKINRLSLRGGDPAATPGAAGGGMGDMGGMGGTDGYSMGGGPMGGGLMAGNGMGGSNSMGAAGGGAASYPGKEFEGNSGGDILAEEFGTVAGAGGMGGMDGGMGGSSAMMMSGGTGDSGAASAPAEEDRYVDEKEGQYKTRAFLLDVVVRDDQLPNLLASLTNSDFPVEIRRVEVHSGVVQTSSGNSGMGGMSMNGGSPGMDLGGRGGKGDEGMDSAMGMGTGNAGMPGMDMGSSGMGSYGMGMSGMGTGGMGLGGMGLGGGGAASSDPMSVALSDPLLVTVKIGGLMTLYQSLAETAAQEETEKAAVTEQSTAMPPDPADMTSVEQGTPAEGTSATTETPAGENANPPADANGTVGAPAANAGDAPASENTPSENASPAGDDPAKSSAGSDGESGESKLDVGSTDTKTGDAAPPAEGEKPASEGPPAGEPGESGEPKSGGDSK